jgi:hypothetical protein
MAATAAVLAQGGFASLTLQHASGMAAAGSGQEAAACSTCIYRKPSVEVCYEHGC